MKLKALIISIKGLNLTRKEKNLLRNERPWGIILFKRNLKSFPQIKKLINEIKIITKNKKFPIIIDEEGATVSRLTNLLNHNISSNFFGDLYQKNKIFTLKILKIYLYSLTNILKDLGFNINTIPVLDILKPYTNKIIGKRGFSDQKKIVRDLGNYTIKYLHSNNFAGVIKHIPGHGRAKTDSHKKMPIVSSSLKDLDNNDFYPFKLSKAKFAMTAHVLYKKIDKRNVATFSKTIIKKIIRKKIGFKGILISDDISMKALKYDLKTNGKKSIEAGCNLVLYCAGNINDNFKLIKSLPYIDKFTSKKTSEFYKFLG